MECIFWFVTTILTNMPKINGRNSSQNQKNEAPAHNNLDLFQILKNIQRSKSPTQESRMKTTSFKFALIITLTISFSAISVKAGITMNEPTKIIQDLLTQVDGSIEANTSFKQSQLNNYNFKRKTIAQDQWQAFQTLSCKSTISSTIQSHFKLQRNKNGALSSISNGIQQLQSMNIKIIITNLNITLTHISTKISTLNYIMQAITWIIIIYTSITIMQKLSKHYASITTPTHPNKNIISSTPPTYSANINTNSSAIMKSLPSLLRTKRYINNTCIHYYSSGHHGPTQRHQLRTLNRILQYGRRCRQINPRQLYYGFIRDCQMERVAHDIKLINDIKRCYHIAPSLNNFNKCYHLASSHFLLNCNLIMLLRVVFFSYKKLLAPFNDLKDKAPLNPSSVTNGCDQSFNSPSVGRPSTRATQLINPLDLNQSKGK